MKKRECPQKTRRMGTLPIYLHITALNSLNPDTILPFSNFGNVIEYTAKDVDKSFNYMQLLSQLMLFLLLGL
jgi:hypothetical protein